MPYINVMKKVLNKFLLCNGGILKKLKINPKLQNTVYGLKDNISHFFFGSSGALTAA